MSINIAVQYSYDKIIIHDAIRELPVVSSQSLKRLRRVKEDDIKHDVGCPEKFYQTFVYLPMAHGFKVRLTRRTEANIDAAANKSFQLWRSFGSS